MQRKFIHWSMALLLIVPFVKAGSWIDFSVTEEDVGIEIGLNKSSKSLLPLLFKSETELAKKKQEDIEAYIQNSPLWQHLLEEQGAVEYHWEKEDKRSTYND